MLSFDNLGKKIKIEKNTDLLYKTFFFNSVASSTCNLPNFDCNILSYIIFQFPWQAFKTSFVIFVFQLLEFFLFYFSEEAI